MQRSVQVFFFENLRLFHSPRIRLSCTLQPTLDTLKPWDTSRYLTFSPPSAVPNAGSKGGAGAHTLESAKFAKVGGRHRDTCKPHHKPVNVAWCLQLCRECGIVSGKISPASVDMAFTKAKAVGGNVWRDIGFIFMKPCHLQRRMCPHCSPHH
jgi:hypothetical protein